MVTTKSTTIINENVCQILWFWLFYTYYYNAGCNSIHNREMWLFRIITRCDDRTKTSQWSHQRYRSRLRNVTSRRLTKQSFRLCFVHKQVQVSVDEREGCPHRRHHGIQPPPAQHFGWYHSASATTTRRRLQLASDDSLIPRSMSLALLTLQPIRRHAVCSARRSIKPVSAQQTVLPSRAAAAGPTGAHCRQKY